MKTMIVGTSNRWTTTPVIGFLNFGAVHNVSSAFNGFNIRNTTGISGEIRVYGYQGA